MEVQTRSECHTSRYAGTFHFDSVAEARAAFIKDPTIWKISFEQKRFRPKTKRDQWGPMSEAKITMLNPAYAAASDDDIFWIHQAVMLDMEKEKEIIASLALDLSILSNKMKQELQDLKENLGIESRSYKFTLYLALKETPQYESNCATAVIQEVLTDAEFVEKYCQDLKIVN